jgi:membrane-bound inhibitor of C-type lysozyme
MRPHRTAPIHAALLAAAVLAAGCATRAERMQDKYVRYRCAGGAEFGVTYQGKGARALVERAGRSDLLTAMPAASGARYGDGRSTLHTKGQQAFIEVDGATVLRDCVAAAR